MDTGMAAAAARRIPRVDASAAAKARAERLRKRTRDNLARNMRAARAALSLTQRQLSELTGVSQTYISQAEQAKRNLSLDIVALLASFLGKTVAELVSD
jgi:DNA-binding XRE family transcriptional regulator